MFVYLELFWPSTDTSGRFGVIWPSWSLTSDYICFLLFLLHRPILFKLMMGCADDAELHGSLKGADGPIVSNNILVYWHHFPRHLARALVFPLGRTDRRELQIDIAKVNGLLIVLFIDNDLNNESSLFQRLDRINWCIQDG